MSNALLIQVPGSSTNEIKFIPFGLLAVSNILRKHNIRVKIIDLCVENIERLEEEIRAFDPSLLGFAGIATSYIRVREISWRLRKIFPNSIFIAGGPLASIYEILLEEKSIDYVFHGEVEHSLPKFIKFIETGEGLIDIGGISFSKEKLKKSESIEKSAQYIKQNDKTIRTLPEAQIRNLDDSGYLDYNSIDLSKYVLDLRDCYLRYKPGIEKLPLLNVKIKKLIESGKFRYFEILTSRGCTHRCRFCYRHVKGIRLYSVGHVINNIKLLKKHCPIDGVYFADELFNSNLPWVYELCDALENPELNLSFFMSGGNRADKVNDSLIKRMSEVGFINMNFGHESGSDAILKYYGKGITRQQNIDSVMLTKKYNVHTCPQLLIGSPLESMRTIQETNDFLKVTNLAMASINYIIPLPETAVWEEVVRAGYIKDVKAYLEKAFKYGASRRFGYNFSKANRLVWTFWHMYLERTIFMNRNKHNFWKRLYYQTYLYKFISLLKYIFR